MRESRRSAGNKKSPSGEGRGDLMNMDIQKMDEARTMLIEWGFPEESATLLLTRATFGLSLEEIRTLFYPSLQVPVDNHQQPSEAQGE